MENGYPVKFNWPPKEFPELYITQTPRNPPKPLPTRTKNTASAPRAGPTSEEEEILGEGLTPGMKEEEILAEEPTPGYTIKGEEILGYLPTISINIVTRESCITKYKFIIKVSRRYVITLEENLDPRHIKAYFTLLSDKQYNVIEASARYSRDKSDPFTQILGVTPISVLLDAQRIPLTYIYCKILYSTAIFNKTTFQKYIKFEWHSFIVDFVGGIEELLWRQPVTKQKAIE